MPLTAVMITMLSPTAMRKNPRTQLIRGSGRFQVDLMENGRTVLAGSADELSRHEHVRKVYLGV